jgi:hypothetical protein
VFRAGPTDKILDFAKMTWLWSAGAYIERLAVVLIPVDRKLAYLFGDS